MTSLTAEMFEADPFDHFHRSFGGGVPVELFGSPRCIVGEPPAQMFISQYQQDFFGKLFAVSVFVQKPGLSVDDGIAQSLHIA